MSGCKSNRNGCPCNRCSKGWFSRRHETSAGQDEARQRYATRASRRPVQTWNDVLKCWVKGEA